MMPVYLSSEKVGSKLKKIENNILFTPGFLPLAADKAIMEAC